MRCVIEPEPQGRRKPHAIIEAEEQVFHVNGTGSNEEEGTVREEIMTERIWQSHEIAHLMEWYGQKESALIAADLGRSRNSVTGFARRIGLSCPARYRLQARAQARNRTTVDVRFFERSGPAVDQVITFIRRRGKVFSAPKPRLWFSCPESEEPELLAVKALLRSHHRVRRHRKRLHLAIGSRLLVESLLQRRGPF